MKRTGKWALSLVSRALVILLVVFLLPYAGNIWHLIMPDVTGEIRTQSRIIEQKLESSQRLEVTKVDEEGVLEAKTNVIIFGTVGSTTIRYRYTASIGIDMSRVVMTTDNDRIIFVLPEPEVLNDGIEALEINRNNLFSKAIEKSVETLLSEQREKCRIQFVSDERHSVKTREDAAKAFRDTVCKWLEGSGERHYEFEIVIAEPSVAGSDGRFFNHQNR